MSEGLFFDTYALVEIYKKSPNYEKYKKSKMILNDLNILEFVYFLLREERNENLSEVFQKLSRFSVPYDEEILISAAKMKHKYRKEKLSFVDCTGYFLAKKHGCKFLTGDEKFRKKENVEFIKG